LGRCNLIVTSQGTTILCSAVPLTSCCKRARALADQVLKGELAINSLERSIDALIGQIIARRQPAAGDLPLVAALSKSTTDLERIADEAKKIALCARKNSSGNRQGVRCDGEIRHMAGLALAMVFVAKSLERVGDHAKNIAEYVVYAVKGKDVRRTFVAEVEREVGPTA